ncbi:hypothetical protein CI109_102387 [Kwoniella shandongensis]|uniref:Uncharacterized protein n=1 Tax=Kwoniella shandongensis TaxID=1734106 RepID=A0A5M6C047_9TREE|nr:uncharacterized protein CI109_003293 [Kwoniella shandongensis]KAA5528393.1 hypothetical protein CI109_003293 [Kwoniella shandongensis]
MIETTVGQLSSHKINTPLSSTYGPRPPYRGASRTKSIKETKTSSKSNGRYYKVQMSQYQDQDQDRQMLINDREDLNSDREGYEGEDDMAELSDSPSTTHTSSRPVTPSNPPIPQVHQMHPPTNIHSHYLSLQEGNTSITSSDGSPRSSSEVFTLAQKAEKILGLVPGSLAHARACLENARDEVKRTATVVDQSHQIRGVSPPADGPEMGVKGRMQTRARKAISLVGFPPSSGAGTAINGQGNMRNVVLGTGGKDEEEQRERRRRAADGVLYWQREVGRLEAEEALEERGMRRV